jgi:putative membrane protein
MSYLITYFKGMLMGIADVVPGVSGGTIALITGIYQRLINSIAAADMSALKLLMRGQIKKTWQHIDGWFLVAVFGGILSAIFLFAGLIKKLLLDYPVLTWSFFFGLIIASALLLLVANQSKHIIHWLLLLFGIALGFVLSTTNLGTLPDGFIGIFIAGCIAICAMILPGISGSLILILLGKYQTILFAVHEHEWSTLLIFSLGCLLGLMLFSRLLKWLLARHYTATIFTLAGLMVGTLYKVWPWKINELNVAPLVQPNPQILLAISLMFLASFLVWLLFKLDKRSQLS